MRLEAAARSFELRRRERTERLRSGRLAWLGLAFVLAFLAAFSMWMAVTTHAAADLARTAGALSETYQQAQSAVAEEESLERKYRLEPTVAVRTRFQAAADSFSSAVVQLRATGAPEDVSLAGNLLDLQDAYLAAISRMFSALDGGDVALVTRIDANEVDPQFSTIEALVGQAGASHHARATDALSQLGQTVGFVFVTTPVVLLVGMSFMALFWLALRRSEGRLRAGAERELANARVGEERFRSLVQNSADVVVIVDRAGALGYASPAIGRTWGYQPDTVRGASLFGLVNPEDLMAARTFLAECLESPGGNTSTELRVATAEGALRQVEVVGTNLIGQEAVDGVVLTFHDVTDQRAFEDQLKTLAFKDSLTDLPNRALFEVRLDQALARAHRRRRSVGVLFLDVDNLKLVNDSLGHATGDLMLRAVADRLRRTIRADDTAARLGGDEFTVLLEDIDGEAEAIAAAERVEAALGEPLRIDGRELFLSASIGVAVSGAALVGPEAMLRNADLAMYQAKLNGKARHESFQVAMEGGALARIELEGDLRQALARGEFAVHYQPIVSLDDGHVVELEALVRWDHPVRGRIMPDQFIPVAEETGLIVPIGLWVLEEACRRTAAWNRDGTARPIGISVNLSARQFQHPGLFADVQHALVDAGLDPGALTLEITESVVMKDPDAAAARLREFRQLGIRVAIDDFGTGYSSLAYLKNFPIDALKIDRSFVSALGRASDDSAIVRSVVALGHALNLTVVGEGVETQEQAAHLQELDCDLGQGYLFDRPMPGPDVAAMLARHAATDDPHGLVASLRGARRLRRSKDPRPLGAYGSR